MGALARFLVAFAALLLAHGQEEAHTSEGFSVESQHATEMHEDPAEHATEEHDEAAEPAPVQEGSLTEYFEDKFHEAEESVAGVVEDVEEAAESFENEVSEVVGGEPDIDEDHHADEHSLEEEAHEHEEEQEISNEHHSEEKEHHLEEEHGFDEQHGFDEHHPEEEDPSKRHPFLEYNGQLDQHADLHKEMLSLTKAKEWCAEHSECMGFYHTGAADEGPFEMTFKDHWELNSEHEEHDPHTAYKKWVGVDLLDAGAPHEEAHDDVSHEVEHEDYVSARPDQVPPASVPPTLRGSMSYHEA